MAALRLATYNIHKFVGADGNWNPERVVSVIRAIDADVVAIQEFTIDTSKVNPPSPQQFAAAAGYRVVEQVMLRPDGQIQYNLLFTRAEIRSGELISLPVPGVEERGAIVAEIDGLRVAATHLGLLPGARRRQLAMLLDFVKNDKPFALMGDMNMSLPFEAARRRLTQEFPGPATPATFPATFPCLALDRIVARPAGLIRAIRAFDSASARKASDHLPLVAEIALP